MLCWLSSLPQHVRLKGRAIHLGPLDTSEGALGAEAHSVGMILAMLKFSIQARYDHLMVLSEHEQAQYDFWRNQCPQRKNIEGRLLRCTVEQVAALPSAVPMQQFTDTRPHGLITEMEEGQPERLLAQYGHVLQNICQRGPPTVLLRLPPQFAQLIS